MTTVRLQRIGEDFAVILPRETVDKLHMVEGDSLKLTDVPAGVVITRYAAEISSQMDVALEAMERYAPALAELAK